MNAKDILTYGHRDVHEAFTGLSGEQWNVVGVTSRWSLKDVLAHLLSYEMMLTEALQSVLHPGSPMPTIDDNANPDFNDRFVAAHAEIQPEELLQAYDHAHHRTMELIEQLKPETLREPGTIPWYGSEYSLDDYLVYANYGHKREHLAQVKQFRKRQGY